MIDLHLHTTASDGTCTPTELIERAAAAGHTTIAVTDHDTMAGVREAQDAGKRLGVEVLAGIEVTAVQDGRDVHVLAYFVPETSIELQELLARQRELRRQRAEEIAARLAAMSAPVDLEALLASVPANGGKSLARPQIARALIAAGHVTTVAEAFDRFLGENCPAYVPHTGASPLTVIDIVKRAGGLTSLAHPVLFKRDELIPSFCEAGLDAIEAYHSAHSPEQQAHYVSMARRLDVAITGGSDFHGPNDRRAPWFGTLSLPLEEYRAFRVAAASPRQVARGR
jgi:predicted metal-dependent phosphoesterase TrpH